MQLQRLGIDIRTLGSTKHLLEDVDLILKSNGMSHGTVSDHTKLSTVKHALQKMLEPGNYFSICVIRECELLLGIHISSERLKVYQPLHCISWKDMLPDFRTMIIAMVIDDFRIIFNS